MLRISWRYFLKVNEKMRLHNTAIEGCYLIENMRHKDIRGTFTKIFNRVHFQENQISLSLQEQFFSVSEKNVLRGMHFQAPPYSHAKLITCLSGGALDVVLDIRKRSKTYGQFLSFNLNSESGLSVWVPEGLAHGFLSLQNNTGMLYSTTHIHVPDHDFGIFWDSFGFCWPCDAPVLSERDRLHPKFFRFDSPFQDIAAPE